ncbi:MAG: bacterioferritin [Candidatus Hydrogenedentota bacterium]
MTKQELIDALNEDLANELSAVIQYITYAAKATGPTRPEIFNFFMGEVPDETTHAQFLANKIVALGGEPVTRPAPVPEAKDNRTMLEKIRDAEKDAIASYSKRAGQATEYGDVGLQVALEDMVRDETNHFEETERMLREWHI